MGCGIETPSLSTMYLHMLVHESLLRMMVLNSAPLMNANVDRSVDECQRRAYWPKWKYAIQIELDSLTKRTVFEPGVPIPSRLKPVE